ncbi:adenine phosphoribosyltransferase [Fusibacter bizertensis]|uniref:Adenine phosphoribosyltransferase n=1 Tax=Fusibacter bizertensis TaxID=1488331 RepID=A0ABT6N9R0_9FIRM|nr:adenine phosphoribosyltransferase [Fusibacter bizertensis]MDH8677134.1 adenine phosphoribosyltransferase [Fusibacter bizertensis]
MDFKSKIRVIEGFPKEGISFKDVTTLLSDGEAYQAAIKACLEMLEGINYDVVVGPEARGFLIGAPLAVMAQKGFVPIRKPGKLPYETIKHEYFLEYGSDVLEVHKDAIKPGDKVLVVDDLLATGGTAKAVCELIEKLGGEVVGLAFLMELDFLDGRKVLDGYKVLSAINYES